jgi:ElaB protein
MANHTTPSKVNEAQDEAERSAGHAGNAARKAGDAARDELSNLKADLDDLVSRIPGLSDVDLEQAKEKLMAKIAASREAARGMADSAREQIDHAREQFHHGVECSEEYVRDHPMQSVGYAALGGFLLGLLISRR